MLCKTPTLSLFRVVSLHGFTVLIMQASIMTLHLLFMLYTQLVPIPNIEENMIQLLTTLPYPARNQVHSKCLIKTVNK